MATILVVDDQKSVLYSFQRVFGEEGYRVITAQSAEEAIETVKKSPPDLVIMDIKMPGMDGLEALEIMKGFYPKLMVIIMTAYSTTEKAINAIKLGAYDYIVKPFDNKHLREVVERAIEAKRIMSEVVTFEGEEQETEERIVGSSSGMIEIYKKIGKIAPTEATVLIRGESGSGKELIARAIYHHSFRADRSFMTVNCAAIPEGLLESELFGYERGAFTGADVRRIGKFEQCSGGTIFLDEIGDMSLPLQSKVLRVLQDGTFQRLGGNEIIKTDVRVIAATNRNLEEMVKNGSFREDLYYRLNVVSISIPPLRERKEDIKELVQYFVRRFNKELKRNVKGIASEILKRLEEYNWPGNVRELRNIIQRAMVFCQKDYLSFECIECSDLFEKPASVSSRRDIEESFLNIIDAYLRNGGSVFQEAISTFERLLVKRALELTNGNQVHAARLLDIARNTLRSKIENSKE
ncbi:MAG: sigma-54 dependent transcriptional regulator [Nitrospirota bacterium]